MKNNEFWEYLVHIAKKVVRDDNSRFLKGSFTISDKDDLDLLRLCVNSQENDEEEALYILEDINNCKVGDKVCIEVKPRVGLGIFAFNIDQLLCIPGALVHSPKRYFLLNEDKDGEEKYQAILRFIEIIKKVAIGFDDSVSTIFFFDSTKFDLPICYSSAVFERIDVNELDSFEVILQKEGHEDQIKEIFSKSIIELTKHLPERDRFEYLLSELPGLKKRINDGYRLYASGFSYEKIKSQIEAAHIDYANKIHKLLSDIQNPLLGIPIAAIIGCTQIAQVHDVGFNFFKNTVVLVGCIVIFIFLVLLVRNQSYTLFVIRKDIIEQKQKLSMFSSVVEDFDKTFENMITICDRQKDIFRIIKCIIFCCIAGVIIFYFYASEPIFYFFNRLIQFLSQCCNS